MKDNTYQEALQSVFRYLAQRAHSRAELKTKLKRQGFDTTVIDKALERLEQLKLIDDRGFAKSAMEAMERRRPEGQLKTRFRLKQKGVSDEIIDELQRSQDPAALCRAAAEKKMRSLSGTPETKRKKLLTFLRNRGFDWNTIQGTLSGMASPESEEDQT
jgi:regulatory protein